MAQSQVPLLCFVWSLFLRSLQVHYSAPIQSSHLHVKPQEGEKVRVPKKRHPFPFRIYWNLHIWLPLRCPWQKLSYVPSRSWRLGNAGIFLVDKSSEKNLKILLKEKDRAKSGGVGSHFHMYLSETSRKYDI